jgi:hypothetical protein
MNKLSSIQWWAVDKIFVDGELFEADKELDPVEVILLKKNLYLAKGDILATNNFVEVDVEKIYLLRLNGGDYICKVTKIESKCIDDDEEYCILHLTKLFDVEKNDIDIKQVDKKLYLMEVNNDQC